MDLNRNVGVADKAAPGTRVQHVYDLNGLDEAPAHPTSVEVMPRRRLSGKSTSEGAALTSETMIIGLIDKARGSGSKLHTHPNEQFNIVLSGTLRVDIDGQTVLVPKGHVIHIPAGTVHSCCATKDGDVKFFVCKDTRHGITGPPIDGKEDGPRILTDAEANVSAASGGTATGAKRYVYDLENTEAIPDGPLSAKVWPKGYVSGKSSSFGCAVSGDRIHIGILHKAAGSGSKLHTHPNEQFNVVLQGTLQVELNGEILKVPAGNAVHIPAGAVHSCCATKDGDVIFIACKDTSGGITGTAIDGIDDGPRYL